MTSKSSPCLHQPQRNRPHRTKTNKKIYIHKQMVCKTLKTLKAKRHKHRWCSAERRTASDRRGVVPLFLMRCPLSLVFFPTSEASSCVSSGGCCVRRRKKVERSSKNVWSRLARDSALDLSLPLASAPPRAPGMFTVLFTPSFRSHLLPPLLPC